MAALGRDGRGGALDPDRRLCACWIGAIVGHPHRPAPARLGRLGALHRPVPDWMGRASLVYALLVTRLSVGVQAIALGRELADISAAATQVARVDLLARVLPHALPELIAVFLPFGCSCARPDAATWSDSAPGPCRPR